MEVKVVSYKRADGVTPFSQWLLKLADPKAKVHVRNRLARLALGNRGDVKRIEGAVFELRIHSGPGYRIYFGEDGETLVILLWGGDKSSQPKDIEKASEYWQDYLRTRSTSE